MSFFWPEGLLPVFLHSQIQKGYGKQVDLVAQLVEHITFNDGALGPSPSGITDFYLRISELTKDLLFYK